MFIVNWFKDKAVILLIGVALFGCGFGFGWMAKGNAVAKAELVEVKQETKATIQGIVEGAESANQADTKAAEAQKEIQIVYKTLYKDRILYRDRPEAKVELDPEWVKEHNKAACGPVSDCLPQEDATTTTGAALEIVSANYEPYYQCKRKLKGLEDLYNEQRARINGEVK